MEKSGDKLKKITEKNEKAWKEEIHEQLESRGTWKHERVRKHTQRDNDKKLEPRERHKDAGTGSPKITKFKPIKSTPVHLKVKFSRVKDREKSLKAATEKKQVTHKGQQVNVTQASQQKTSRPGNS